MATDTGTVVEVRVVSLGDELAVAAAPGASTLTVQDAVDFEETGGSLTIGDPAEVLGYTGADDDTGVITLDPATPLTGTYAVEERVELSPRTWTKVAQVMIGDFDEAVEAVVPHALYDRMAEGIRADGEGEVVDLDLVEDEFVIADIVGSEPEIDGAFIENLTAAPDWAQLDADLEQLNRDLAQLNDVDLPQLRDDLGVARTDIDTLNTTTLPELENELKTIPIDGARIIDNTIIGDKVVANSIYGDRIIANTLNGDRVIANTVTGDRIIANTLQGDKIVGNSISGDKIMANAIDGKTITGMWIRTAWPGASQGVPERVELGQSGGGGRDIRFHTGEVSQTQPGAIENWGNDLFNRGVTRWLSPSLNNRNRSEIRMFGQTDDGLIGSSVSLRGDMIEHAAPSYFGDRETGRQPVAGLDYGGTTSVTTNASGDFTVNHKLGITPRAFVGIVNRGHRLIYPDWSRTTSGVLGFGTRHTDGTATAVETFDIFWLAIA